MTRNRGQEGSVADNEAFVTLIQLAREDPEMHQRLVAILRLEDFQRVSLLNTWIGEMRLKGDPAETIAAIAYLKDPGIAGRALAILEA